MEKHLLVVFANAVDGREDEFNKWFTNQHLADVLKCEGFSAVQRFELSKLQYQQHLPYRYLAIYEVPDDKLETAFSSLAAAREDRILAEREGRRPSMPISNAMVEDRILWWFSAITNRISKSP